MTKFFTLVLAAAIGCASIGCSKDKEKAKDKDGKKGTPAEKEKKKD